jgi:hypothetical protein
MQNNPKQKTKQSLLRHVSGSSKNKVSPNSSRYLIIKAPKNKKRYDMASTLEIYLATTSYIKTVNDWYVIWYYK